MMKTKSSSNVRNQFDLLSQMVEDISGELALEPLLNRLVERACHLIGADDGLIGLYVPEADLIRTTASHNIPMQELVAELPRGYGLTGRVLELDAPVRGYYNDLPMPAGYTPPGRHVIGMPIRARGQLIGVFNIAVHAPRLLDEEAEELLALFARHAAIAIDNARRYSNERRRASRFALISRVVALGASGTDLDELLQHAADAIHEILEYPNVDIPLLDVADRNTLVIRIRGGGYKRLIQGEDRLSINRGIMGAAVRERRVQLVNDITTDSRYVLPPGVRPPLCELAIPIAYGDEVLGVLNVEGDCTFDQLDCVSLEIVAEHLGIAIVNARLLERSAHAAVLVERHRLARELHDNVTQILSSMSLITQSLTEAWRRDPVEGERRVERLSELSRLAFAEMRDLLQELSPSTRVARYRRDTDSSFLFRLQRVLSAMVPSNVQLDINVANFRPQAQTHEDTLLRVCQEAVSNAVRHAAPSTIKIRTMFTRTRTRLSVIDDGSGISEKSAQGMGLGNMRGRLSELGGRLRITSQLPHGTRVQASLPRSDLTRD